ncbi:MAG: deoxynucleoside kinase [Ignavibacteria bacterium]
MKENKKYFVSIAGNIGSGKSSLTKKIAEKLGWAAYFESVKNNPYLEDFYKDMKRWSFQLQVYFLSHRFKIHKEITASKVSVIQDRSIYEDVDIFARNLSLLDRMEKRDYLNYRKLFQEMTFYLKPPDLIVYLKANIDTLIKQIKLRGRTFEQGIEKKYLEKLNESYNKWIKKYNLGKVLVIQTDELDFVHNKSHFNLILNKIKTSLG